MRIFKVKNVGSDHGDCFFIEIQNSIWKSIIMVDGRCGKKASLNEISDVVLTYGHIDYLVITHVDQDHLLGVKKLFERDVTDSVRKAFEKTVILYNYVTKPVVSYRQAKEFEELILDNCVISTVLKNYILYSSPCLKIISSEMRRNLDPREQGEYAVMTLLHPKREGIEEVYRDYMNWELNNDYSVDSPLINKHSIVFLLEYADKCILFTGDCEMEEIIEEVDQLKNMSQNNYRKIDLIKISHHGAYQNNRELPKFASNHKCTQYFVTGRETWDGDHPSKDLLKEIVDEVEEDIEVFTHVNIDSENGYHIIPRDEIILIGEAEI